MNESIRIVKSVLIDVKLFTKPDVWTIQRFDRVAGKLCMVDSSIHVQCNFCLGSIVLGIFFNLTFFDRSHI